MVHKPPYVRISIRPSLCPPVRHSDHPSVCLNQNLYVVFLGISIVMGITVYYSVGLIAIIKLNFCQIVFGLYLRFQNQIVFAPITGILPI